MTLELGVLISGTGTNLGAILDATRAGALDARVRLVVSNRAEAAGLERARQAGVTARVVPHGEYSDRAAFERAIVAALRDTGVEWVVLAGFMRLLTPCFLDAFPHRILNVHPALLPAFAGIDGQGQALQYGVKIAGCTVHLVDAGTDTGPIIAQAAVPVFDDDTRETLRARILVREHQLLVEVLGWIAAGRVEVLPGANGRARTRVRGASCAVGVELP